jgi:hypothetical protein
MIIHKFLDKEYNIHELIIMFLVIILFGFLVGYIFGYTVQKIFGIIIISVAIYGIIRNKFFKNKKK